jgi:L-malate glycosyltransferase
MKILHIVGHTGGGVKTVLLNWILNDKENKHDIISFGYADEEVKQKCLMNDIFLYDEAIPSIVISIMEDYTDLDIVIIHYWNFPLLIDFLINNTLPPCRIITWCHMSGLYAPYSIPEKIIEYSDKFIFTSPISYNSNTIKNNLIPMSKLDCIWSTGGTKYKDVVKKEHGGFNILYVGTLDFSKLREDFIIICKEIMNKIPEARITICGDGANKSFLQTQVNCFNLQDNIKFEGLVSDLTPYFEITDIFLYPLQEKNFSTCEQVLGESQCVGIPAIVFNNPNEKEIISQGVNGFIVDNIEQCINGVIGLYKDIEYRNKLGENAKQLAVKKYSTSKMLDDWNRVFNEIMQLPKKEREWYHIYQILYENSLINFLESLDDSTKKIFQEYIAGKQRIKKLFESNPQWYSKSKGSIYQYLEYFPDSKWLNEFKKIMEE